MRSPIPERPQDHGPGSEHMVPGDRSQSTEIRREYLQSQRRGLHQGHTAGVSIKGISITSAGDGSQMRDQGKGISSTRSACSRVTVGKLSKNSSSVRPASKLLM